MSKDNRPIEVGDRFEASNGVNVAWREYGGGITFAPLFDLGALTGIDADQADALREFFRAEEDERLGRWRRPEDPDFVVYVRGGGQVARVFRESTAQTLSFGREDHIGSTPSQFGAAARAFFDAHPEPKPWHNAKPGEAWVLTVDGEEYPWGVGNGPDAGRFVYLGGLSNLPIDHPSITAGRRIYPEQVS
jgi:hypothetical protein